VVEGSRTVPADLGALADVRTWAVRLAAAGGLGPGQLAELELALTEAVSNVIRHANVEGRPIELHLAVDDEEVRVLVADRGDYWPGQPVGGPRADGSGGYGIDLIDRIMDRVERRPRDGGGTELLLVMARRG
jgi:anti-sigma regulatory factor (Ser/Thr protein kinase)